MYCSSINSLKGFIVTTIKMCFITTTTTTTIIIIITVNRPRFIPIITTTAIVIPITIIIIQP